MGALATLSSSSSPWTSEDDLLLKTNVEVEVYEFIPFSLSFSISCFLFNFIHFILLYPQLIYSFIYNNTQHCSNIVFLGFYFCFNYILQLLYVFFNWNLIPFHCLILSLIAVKLLLSHSCYCTDNHWWNLIQFYFLILSSSIG